MGFHPISREIERQISESGPNFCTGASRQTPHAQMFDYSSSQEQANRRLCRGYFAVYTESNDHGVKILVSKYRGRHLEPWYRQTVIDLNSEADEIERSRKSDLLALSERNHVYRVTCFPRLRRRLVKTDGSPGRSLTLPRSIRVVWKGVGYHRIFQPILDTKFRSKAGIDL